MTQTIGFIGSGAISSQVARLAVAAGMDVILSNTRGPESLSALISELGNRARAATPAEAARDAELVVASIPFYAYSKLSAEALAGKVVIDTMNYYPERDGHMPEIDTARVATSELVQRHLSRSRVVRALNNMDWVRLRSRARPVGASDRSALPIASDDAEAKAAVSGFLGAIGYDAVDLGPLADSWRSEPTTPVYVLPYLGTVPSDVRPEAARAWFLQAPGAPVSVQQVKTLVARAVRHERMFGDVGPLPGAAI
ncbi:oxidoreductase [Corallococcus carmarthensis]|uniref:Oxidoreductase n=1 Tax=Corallococcus carmarthensis TaxID=2316728 RepID=A0A3A8K790_9BACT|nr:NAD(P)-binding domain-containing protein [Corallococcus carmarthensis]RKG98311.1 oxidoreductase [Corallococcus carmarthensis]